MSNMFSGIGEIKKESLIYSWGRTPNVQCQRDVPDHDHLPFLIINGARKLPILTMWEASTPNKTVSPRPLLEQVGHQGC